MKKKLEYKYNDHIIGVTFPQHSSVISATNLTISCDGEKLPYENRGLGDIAWARLPGGEELRVLTYQPWEDTAYGRVNEDMVRVIANNQRLDLIQPQREYIPNRNIDDLKKLSQFSDVIKDMKPADFIPFKDNQRIGLESRYYRYIGDGDIPKEMLEMTSTGKLEHKDLEKIQFGAIEPGDKILIQPPPSFLPKNFSQDYIAINNVEFADIYRDSFVEKLRPVIRVLEGDGQVLASTNTDTLKKDVSKLLEQKGLTFESFADAISPNTTMDEFVCIQTLAKEGIEINDQILQDLVDGKSIDEIVQTNQDININEIGDNIDLSSIDATIDLDTLSEPNQNEPEIEIDEIDNDGPTID